MKKIIALLICLLVIPLNVHAANYIASNLEETLESENIKYKIGGYKESPDKVNIYLFRGQGCDRCQDFLKFVSDTLLKDYSDYFNLVSYEVYNHPQNEDLLNKVIAHLNDKSIDGVPLILVGDGYFIGYDKSMNSSILKELEEAYNAKERVDIIDEVTNTEEEKKTETDKPNRSVILFIIGMFFIGSLFYILKSNSDKQEIMATLYEIEEKLKSKK